MVHFYATSTEFPFWALFILEPYVPPSSCPSPNERFTNLRYQSTAMAPESGGSPLNVHAYRPFVYT